MSRTVSERKPRCYWEELVEKYEGSGGKQGAFAKKHGINVWTFRNAWLHRLRRERSGAEKVRFVQVQAASQRARPVRVKLTTPSQNVSFALVFAERKGGGAIEVTVRGTTTRGETLDPTSAVDSYFVRKASGCQAVTGSAPSGDAITIVSLLALVCALRRRRRWPT